MRLRDSYRFGRRRYLLLEDGSIIHEVDGKRRKVKGPAADMGRRLREWYSLKERRQAYEAEGQAFLEALQKAHLSGR